jgi:ABC-type phosphate transport system substrate-binding protein
MRFHLILAGLLLAVAPISAQAQGEFKLIVNSATPISELSEADVSNLFLKKVAKFPSGGAAVPVDQPKASAVRAAFSKKVHGRPVAAVDAYWQQQIFAGGDSPPVSKASDDDVVAFVKANASAIGYVSAAAATAGVKVITIK